MRHKRPDGTIWVRTYPLTCLHDHTTLWHRHEWDQLTYAASGVMRVHTEGATWVVPPHGAVWLPARTLHAEQMHAPVSMRSLYFVPGIAKSLPRECRIVNISPLLRELILHVSRIGALDRAVPAERRLIGVVLDELAHVADTQLQLPMPKDPRALALARLLVDRPDEDGSVASLARRVGGSRRTLERLFTAQTKMTVGEWRRRLRLLHAIRLLAGGEPVTTVALEAGYSSTSAFIAVFKKVFGTTPGRYAG